MGTLILTTGQSIYHMEVDLRSSDRILFSDAYGLKAVADGTVMTIVGAHVGCSGYRICDGYAEEVGTFARFDKITGFAQLNLTTTVVADNGNHCLRIVDRESLQTSILVGQCEARGDVDGLIAQFNAPYSVVQNRKNLNQLLVTDYTNQAVRQIDLITRNVQTLITPPAGLTYPSGLTFDQSGENLIITNNHFIGEKNSGSRSLVNIIGRGLGGFKDGSLTEAVFRSPRELAFLSDKVALLADRDNGRVRVLNLEADFVFSICDGAGYRPRNGPIQTCQTYRPSSILVTDGLIYVGQDGAIRTLPCEYDVNSTLYWDVAKLCII